MNDADYGMDDRMTAEQDQVLIACRDDGISDRFTQVLGDCFAVTQVATWQDSVSILERSRFQVLLLDPALLPDGRSDAVRDLSVAAPDVRMIILESADPGEIDQIALFRNGVHGFCGTDISPDLLVKAVTSVCNGELWMQRGLITRVVEDLARVRSPAAGNKVKCLTPRELEVAQMVHRGGNNKTIARKLDISERTVKAHLSAIFRKLEIENRLHLALFFNDIA